MQNNAVVNRTTDYYFNPANTNNAGLMFVQRRIDDGPALSQHWLNVLCLLGSLVSV